MRVRSALGLAATRADCLFEEKQYYAMGYYPDHVTNDKSWVLCLGGNEQLALVHDMRTDSNGHSVAYLVNISLSNLACEELEHYAQVQAAQDAGVEPPLHPAIVRIREYHEGLRSDPDLF